MTTTAATPSSAYSKCAEKWSMIDDLCGGTRSMRLAGEKWLPREEKETHKRYESRLNRSVLYGAYRDTINNAVAKPFSQPVTLGEKESLHEMLKPIEYDVDRNGQTITDFGSEAFKSAIKYGLTHAIVDFPPRATDEEGNPIARTLQDQRDGDIRPYWVHVPPTSLIGWRNEIDNRGREITTMARIKSEYVENDGEFGEKTIHRVTVWDSQSVRIFEASEDKEDAYMLVDERPHTFGRVPLRTLYIEQHGEMQADLPFEDLAWLNIAHWQSFSDQRNILRVARVPLIVAAGFTSTEINDDMTVSTSQFFRSKNPDASIKHVEHSGKAIEAGEKDLLRLEERMTILGLQPFIQQVGKQSATGKAIDQAQTHTQIQEWIRKTESFLVSLYDLSAEWIDGAAISEDFTVSINNDFGFSINATQDVANLIKARLQGELSRRTFLHELKRRGFLSEGVNIDKEIVSIEEEIPAIDPDDEPSDALEPEPEIGAPDE